MAMKPYRRAVATTGSYTDRQGVEKKRYTTVGTLFQYDDGGFALKLDCVPVGEGWNGFISFFEIEEKTDAGRSPGGSDRGSKGSVAGGGDRGSRQTDSIEDRDIPFITAGDR